LSTGPEGENEIERPVNRLFTVAITGREKTLCGGSELSVTFSSKCQTPVFVSGTVTIDMKVEGVQANGVSSGEYAVDPGASAIHSQAYGPVPPPKEVVVVRLSLCPESTVPGKTLIVGGDIVDADTGCEEKRNRTPIEAARIRTPTSIERLARGAA
jgi:hypothetical protein